MSISSINCEKFSNILNSSDPTTCFRYHYFIDQDFVEQTLWTDETYQRNGFFEHYYDTHSFDLFNNDRFLIEIEDEYNSTNRFWVLKERCQLFNDILCFEKSVLTLAEIETKLELSIKDLQKFCSLRVDRYWKSGNIWYDTVMLEGQTDSKYYAVSSSNTFQQGKCSVASKLLAFISSDETLKHIVYNNDSFTQRRLSKNERQLASSVCFFNRIPKASDAEFCA